VNRTPPNLDVGASVLKNTTLLHPYNGLGIMKCTDGVLVNKNNCRK
jgi:hypothetical protein